MQGAVAVLKAASRDSDCACWCYMRRSPRTQGPSTITALAQASTLCCRLRQARLRRICCAPPKGKAVLAAGSELAADWEPLVDEEGSFGHFFEFPSVSPARRGRSYRYAYGACATRPTSAANSLVKFDNETRSCKASLGLCLHIGHLPAT
jgi:hypothetical protein